jgi:hypothetical protein
MSISRTFSGVTQADTAVMERAGSTYRCYVYLNAARNRVDGSIFVEQADGQSVLVWAGTIRDTATDGAVGAVADCPKVLATSTRFVAHWVESGTPTTLHRSLGFTDGTWTDQGSVTIARAWPIYDAQLLRGGSDEFVVAVVDTTAGVPATGTARVTRYESPWSWTDILWTQLLTAAVEPRVIAVVGDTDADGVVGIALQEALNLELYQLDAANGLNEANGQVSAGLADAQFAQVAMVQYPGSSVCAVVAEYALEANQGTGFSDAVKRSLLYRDHDLGSGAAAQTTLQTIPNQHMASRPWVKRNGLPLSATAGDGYEVFVATTLNSNAFIGNAYERTWDQTYGFVVRLQRDLWGPAVAVNVVRPVLCSILGSGGVDGRPSGDSPNAALASNLVCKRMNHVSSVGGAAQFTQGPDVRSVVFALMHFDINISGQDQDYAEGERDRAQAAVKGIRFYHEEPWTERADVGEPTLPLGLNYRGWAPYAVGRSIETEGGLVFAGGVMSQFDGRQLVELGFPWIPVVDATFINMGGGPLVIEEGTYWVTATYTWTDRRGVVHRSAPAVPQQVDVPLFGAISFSYDIMCMNLSLKDDRFIYPGAPRILIEIWRTALITDEPEGSGVGSTTFRRVFSGPTVGAGLSDTPLSDATQHRIESILDVQTNAVLQYSDPLPWQLDTETLQWNLATPIPTVSGRALASWRNRIFSVPHDDPNVIQYSDTMLPIRLQKVAAEHFDSNRYRFDAKADIVAMHAMDNDLIVLTRTGLYALSGYGNDGTGTGSTLELQVIAEGTGCVEEASVVLTPAGLMFQSDKGFYILNREQQLDHASAGAALTELVRTMGNVRAGTLLEDRHIVRYVANRQVAGGSESPILLDYNYELKIWAEQTIQPLSSAGGRDNALQAGMAWRGLQGQVSHVLLAQNALAIERGDDDAVYADEIYNSVDVAIPLSAQTEWIHLGGISGLVRVRRIGIQTERVNTGPLQVDIFHDVVGDYDDVNPTDTFSWADAPPYIVVKPRIPKCSAIMLRIYEGGGVVPLTENVRIVSITLEIGTKKRTRRVPVGNVGV